MQDRRRKQEPGAAYGASCRTRHEDEQHDLGLHHTVDETGEELGLVGGIVGVLVGEALEPNRELDITRPNLAGGRSWGMMCAQPIYRAAGYA